MALYDDCSTHAAVHTRGVRQRLWCADMHVWMQLHGPGAGAALRAGVCHMSTIPVLPCAAELCHAAQPVGEVKEVHDSDSDISERERIRTKPGRKARSSVYVGVSHLKDGKWQAQIGINSRVRSSSTPLEHACLNIPPLCGAAAVAQCAAVLRAPGLIGIISRVRPHAARRSTSLCVPA